MDEVKSSAAWVASHSSHVSINSSELEKVVEKMKDEIPTVEWDFEGIHYFDGGPHTLQYLLVLDALNFCFWPDEELNYDHLALGLKRALEHDNSAFDADRLQQYTGPDLQKMLKWPRPLPLEDERVRLLHEVGRELERNFQGKASNLVESCGKSAVKLVSLLTRHFPGLFPLSKSPFVDCNELFILHQDFKYIFDVTSIYSYCINVAGFRDHTVYKGHQVFLYKRAQIFVADLWGAFKGQSFGEFSDIGSITIFADYIVPAVLQHLGILSYSPSLASVLEEKSEIVSGTEEEVELRACSIHAVEKMRDMIRLKSGKKVLSVELDLWLWSYGIQLPFLVHHRTLSIYY